MKIQSLNINYLSFSAKAKEKKKSSQSLQNSEMTSIESAAIRVQGLSIIKPSFKERRQAVIQRAIEQGEKEIAYLKDDITPENIEFAEILYSDERLKPARRMHLLFDLPQETTPLQNNFLKKLCLNKDFPPEHIEECTFLAEKYNLDFLDILCNDRDFPKQEIGSCLASFTANALKSRQLSYSLLRANETIKANTIAKIIKEFDLNDFQVKTNLTRLIAQDEFYDEEELSVLYKEIYPYKLEFWMKIHPIMKHYGYPDDIIHQVMRATHNSEFLEENLRAIKQIEQTPNFPKDISARFITGSRPHDYIYYQQEDFKNQIARINELKNIMLANPELYIEGEIASKVEAEKEIKGFLNDNLLKIIDAQKIYDKEAMIAILRKRFSNAEEVLRNISILCVEDSTFKILRSLVNAKDENGKEYDTNQKIDFVELARAYKDYMPKEKYNELRNSVLISENINISRLQNEVLEELFKDCKVDKKYIKTLSESEKRHWIKHCHHIFKAESRTAMFSKILTASLKYPNFKDYVTSKENENSDNYLESLLFFNGNGLNFDSWLNPDINNNVQFKSSDTSEDKIKQIISQIEEDFEFLRQTPAKGFIDKHFREFIKDGNFKVPPKYYNKQSLETFLNTAYELLDKNVFKRAQKNADNMNTNKLASATLTIKNHLAQRLEDIKELDKTKTKSLDLTIKMWDRNPKVDLFQGNYSSCCIGIGNVNQSAIIDYLTMPMFNMIEIVDNKANQIIGNALCYFALDSESKKPVFIIDNIEIAPKYKPSDKTSVELRNAIVKYCKNIIKNVKADDDTPIYLGKNFNDLSSADLKTTAKKIEFLATEDQVYLDAFGGWNYGDFIHQRKQNLYVLN